MTTITHTIRLRRLARATKKDGGFYRAVLENADGIALDAIEFPHGQIARQAAVRYRAMIQSLNGRLMLEAEVAVRAPWAWKPGKTVKLEERLAKCIAAAEAPGKQADLFAKPEPA